MTPRQTPGEEENSTYQNPKLRSHHICNIYVLKADQVTPISSAPVNCLDQADAAGSASHVERWDPNPSDCPPNVSVSETGHLYVMLLLRGWWHVAKQLYLDTLLSTHTLSCHCSNLNFILPLIVSEVYIGNRTVRDELKEARRWYDCPLRSDMAVHVVECVIFQLCGSLFHNINCPPPKIFVTAVACMMINSVRLSPWLHSVRIDGLQRLAIHHHCVGISGICSWSHRMAGAVQ